MRALITGGAGFIGSRLAAKLIARGDEVVILDDLSTGAKGNVPSGAALIEADISDPKSLGKLGGRFDAVCHLAAQSSGEVSSEKPLLDFQVNAASTLLLSRWALEKRVRRFLYASSMAAYGQPEKSGPVSESVPCVPLTQYGVSKLASEHILRLAQLRGLETTSFRMFSVYGAGQNMDNLKQGMVSIYLAYVMEGKEIPVKGSFDRFRDFVHVDDVCAAWLSALDRPSTPSLVYNLGSGRATTVRELLEKLLAACGERPGYPAKELPGTPGDQFGLCADASLAQRELGWTASVPLERGLREMADWARARKTAAARTA